MKSIKNKILFLFLCCSLVIGLLYIPTVKGVIPDDIEYTFNDDILQSESIIFNETDSYNVRNQSISTQTYNATYSFTNEINDTSGTDITFIDVDDNINMIIQPFRIGHDKVMLYDNDGLIEPSFHNLDEITEGTIELYILLSQNDDWNVVRIKDGSDIICIYLEFRGSGFIAYNDGSYHNIQTYISDIWYHLRIDFETGGGSYLGLTNQWQIAINGLQYGSFNYFNNPTAMDDFEIIANGNVVSYYDAIGFNFEQDYQIGSNIIPLVITNTTIKQVDKYQFDYKLTNYTDLRTAQGFEFGSWNVNNTDPELIKIIANPENEGMMVSIPAPSEASVSENLGIWKDFNTKGNTINITWQIYVFSWSIAKYISITIYSYNNISIATILFDYKTLLFDGNTLFSHLARNNLYTCNLYINHNDGFSILRVKNSTDYIGTFYNPLSSLGKTGLGKVEFFLEINPTETILTGVDSIGAYMNSTSLCIDEFGYLNQPITTDVLSADGYTSFWSLHQYNLLTFNGIANISFYITSMFGGFKIFPLSNLVEYTGSRIINVYHNNIPIPTYPALPEPNSRPSIPNATLRYYFFRELIAYSLTIHGVKMDEGSNRYHPHYTNNEVNTITESFFYVDSGNRLRFSIIFNDTNLEYITASFTIGFVNTTDVIFGFRSNRNDVGVGNIQLSYIDDTSNIINIPIIDTSINTILTQEKILDIIIITLTDLNIDTTLGLMSGYISRFRFIYAQNIFVSIITTSILQLIIPLIMIIIPSIAFSVKVGRIAILPMFITMSLICFITSIIPLWLFFVIGFASSFFIFLEKKLKDVQK